MTDYAPPVLSVAILDFQRPDEARRLLDSLDENLKVPAQRVYCHDGPPPDYVLEFLRAGRIHTLITTSQNQGCGIQTRQLFQACLSSHILYCQVDQYLIQPFDYTTLQGCLDILRDPATFYIDLAGNQGHGKPSERALLMDRKKYLAMPNIDRIIGGPGPFADYLWTEQYLQEYMRENQLRFATVRPMFFADNGKWSRRAYPCGGETLHSTDEKTLLIIKPLKQRYDFPNLRLNDEEWEQVLGGTWPVEGKIPEADKESSFKAW